MKCCAGKCARSEGGWYAADKINRSRERLQRLGYFTDVNVETPAVPGTTDQVDLNYSVTEKPTGSIMAGAGFSSSEGLILSGSISQQNVFGSGNYLAAQINSGSINKVYSLSFTDPYFTDDGVSRGFDVYKRTVNTTSLNTVSTYSTSTLGGGVRFGIPLNEKDSVSLGLALEKTDVSLTTSASCLCRTSSNSSAIPTQMLASILPAPIWAGRAIHAIA